MTRTLACVRPPINMTLTTRCPASSCGTPPPLSHSTAHQAYYTGHPPPPPQHCTPGVLHGTPPLLHSTAHQAYYTVPRQPLWDTPPLPPQHCTPGVLHGAPPAFVEHPPPPPQHCTPGVLHGAPPAFVEHPPSPTALHTRRTTRCPVSLCGTPPLPHSTAHQAYYTVPRQPLWDTPPSPTALHTAVLHQPFWCALPLPYSTAQPPRRPVPPPPMASPPAGQPHTLRPSEAVARPCPCPCPHACR